MFHPWLILPASPKRFIQLADVVQGFFHVGNGHAGDATGGVALGQQFQLVEIVRRFEPAAGPVVQQFDAGPVDLVEADARVAGGDLRGARSA